MTFIAATGSRIAGLQARLPRGLASFLAVGVAGLLAHTGVFTALFHLGLDRTAAWTGGLFAGTLLTWSLNRRHTFAATGRRAEAEMARYAAVTLVAQGTSFLTFHTGCALMPAVVPALHLICGSAVGAVFSYAGQRFFTFAPTKPSF